MLNTDVTFFLVWELMEKCGSVMRNHRYGKIIYQTIIISVHTEAISMPST